MKPELIVGIDVSKCTLDICLKPAGTTFKTNNDLAGFKVLKNLVAGQNTGNVLVVMEHTGLYSLKLEKFLKTKEILCCKVPALEIKRSLGVTRGKTDKIDAMRIAQYGWLRREELKETPMADDNIFNLRNLLSLRAKLVKDRSGYIARLKELKFAGINIDPIAKTHQEVIKTFSEQIKKIESSITTLIASDVELSQTCGLLLSMKGVGKIIAAYMIAFTENFKKFSNARKFNCYSGLAPFKNESGTSKQSKSRVSHLANKEIKTLLNLGACCAIRYNQELREYYQKRVAEGKAKMSCINIIRSKMVARMFSIIKRQTPYQDILAAA